MEPSSRQPELLSAADGDDSVLSVTSGFLDIAFASCWLRGSTGKGVSANASALCLTGLSVSGYF